MIYRVDPLLSAGVVSRPHALFVYARAYSTCTFRARPHTYTSVFPHEGPYTYARARPRENAHTHAHDAYERARADTHAPWHAWAWPRTHTRTRA